jgi:NAD-dependent dihydropyrimidine dehydrogenase PreA subunit
MTVAISTACTACGACLATCPTGALAPAARRPHVVDAACIDCLACVEVCPSDAIVLVAVGLPPFRDRASAGVNKYGEIPPAPAPTPVASGTGSPLCYRDGAGQSKNSNKAASDRPRPVAPE